MKINAYAKINLFLDIVSRREDGYHDICGVMQSINLFDELLVERNNEGTIRLTCDKEGIPCDESNLAVKAAKRYFEYTGKPFGVDISIKKRIPMAAGLAGGSADAAAVLIALNELEKNRFSISELASIGATLGADIPFCVTGGAAITEGIGERLTAISPLSGGYIVIAKGGEGVSTPAAYSALDAKYPVYTPEYNKLEALKKALKENDFSGVCRNMHNIFEDVVLPTHSMAAKIKQSLLDNGADGAMMSGSGPSVFGLFRDRAAAETALAELLKMNTEAFLCEL